MKKKIYSKSKNAIFFFGWQSIGIFTAIPQISLKGENPMTCDSKDLAVRHPPKQWACLRR